MTIYTDMPIRRGPFYLEDYEASLGASVNAAAEGAFVTNPVPSIMRMRELSRAELGVGSDILDYNPFGAQPPSTASEMMDAASARQKIKDEGLDLTVPDDGIRSRALDILIERKKEERQRNDALARGPGGFVAGTARLGVNLAVSALDPLNVASAFIPVIGEARYAAMLGRASGPLGRAGVRATVGAAEGAVGAAAVEPLVYGAARQEQADYDLTDSIANIALGTVLGGGLHVGAGVIADAVSAGRDWRTARAPADAPIPRMMEAVDAGTREAALRSAISQAATGREISVEPVVSYASRQGFEEPLRAGVGPAEVPSLDNLPPSTQARFRQWFGESKIVDEGGKPQVAYHGTAKDFAAFDPRTIGTALGSKEEGAFFFSTDPETANHAASVASAEDDIGASVIPVYLKAEKPFTSKLTYYNGALVTKEINKAKAKGYDSVLFPGIKYKGEAGTIAVFSPKQIKSAFNTTFDPNTDTLLDALPPLRERGRIAQQPQDLRTTASASFAPEQMRLYDGEAVRLADQRLAEAPTDEAMPETSLQEVMEDVQRLADALGDPEIVGRELADVNDLAETAAAYGRGVQAAADCRIRRG